MAGNVNRILQLRRDTLANIPTLKIGEPYFATDTNELYIGTASDGNQKVNQAYSPMTPSNWASTPPTTLSEAIDRLAAYMDAFTGNPVP